MDLELKQVAMSVSEDDLVEYDENELKIVSCYHDVNSALLNTIEICELDTHRKYCIGQIFSYLNQFKRGK